MRKVLGLQAQETLLWLVALHLAVRTQRLEDLLPQLRLFLVLLALLEILANRLLVCHIHQLAFRQVRVPGGIVAAAGLCQYLQTGLFIHQGRALAHQGFT
jgi:hypothetical protein